MTCHLCDSAAGHPECIEKHLEAVHQLERLEDLEE